MSGIVTHFSPFRLVAEDQKRHRNFMEEQEADKRIKLLKAMGFLDLFDVTVEELEKWSSKAKA